MQGKKMARRKKKGKDKFNWLHKREQQKGRYLWSHYKLQGKQGKTDKSVTQQKKELCQNWIVRPFHSDTQPIWLCFNSSWVCWVSGPGSSSSEKPQMSPPELPLGGKLPSGNSFRSLQEHKHLPVQLQSLNFCSERAHQEQAKGTEPPSKYLFLHSSLS